MTIREALRQAAQAFQNTSDAPDLDAQRLVSLVVNRSETSWLFAHGEVSLTAPQELLLEQLTARRAGGEPLAYIVGTQEFYGRNFVVTPDVLIPRPTTEDLIDQALILIDRLYQEKQRPLIIADVGAGSGCIAVTLLLERPAKIERVLATDISEKALAIAQKNAAGHGVANHITFLRGSLLEPLVNTNIDLVVSNPPYMPTAELDDMTGPEKRGLAHEPRIALDGGANGQQYTAVLMASGRPTILETVSGKIQQINL